MGSRGALAAALLMAAGGCGEPPALEVGRLGFATDEIALLAEAERQTLAELTAFGLAVSDRRVADLIDPFVRRDVRSLVLQRTAMELAARSSGLDEAALRAAYERSPEPELVVRHVVVVSERWRPAAHRDSARARALEARARVRGDEAFETVVARYSDEPGAAERGGLLAPGRRESWVAEFWRAAAALREGEVSEVVETEYGFHVLRLEERRTVPFEEARAEVLERLVDLSEAFRRSSEWVAEQTAGSVVDTAAVAEWQMGRDPGRPLVLWPGADIEPYRAADLDEYASTMPPEVLADWRRRPTGSTVAFVEGVARNNVMLRHAADVGIEASEAQQVAVERGWTQRVDRWAQALGFTARMSDRSIRARALANATSYNQDVLQARSEVHRMSTRLLALYPVTLREAPTR